jgi:hypothetical protein
MSDFCRQGYEDTHNYLENNNYLPSTPRNRSRRKTCSNEWENAIARKRTFYKTMKRTNTESDIYEHFEGEFRLLRLFL